MGLPSKKRRQVMDYDLLKQLMRVTFRDTPPFATRQRALKTNKRSIGLGRDRS